MHDIPSLPFPSFLPAPEYTFTFPVPSLSFDPPPRRLKDDEAFRVLEAIDRHFSPGKSMVLQASTDVEELEKIIVEESKKRVENRDLAMEPN